MNEKAPERLIVCMNGYKPAIADWAKDAMRECDVEYVRADLLITSCKEARRAAFKDAAALARVMAAGETYETGRQKALNSAAALEAKAGEGGRDG